MHPTQIGSENSTYSQNATQLLYYSTLKWKTSEINAKEAVEKLAKVEEALTFAAGDFVVGICVNVFYSHLILNDPQKDLTHYHLSMLKCPTSHVAYSTAQKKKRTLDY